MSRAWKDAKNEPFNEAGQRILGKQSPRSKDEGGIFKDQREGSWRDRDKHRR